MKLFSTLYHWTLQLARHRHAPYYLGGISFIESSFFPVPPDVLLAPMVLARPDRAWSYATLTTLTSVIGALFGYLLGIFFFEWIFPGLIYLGYMQDYQKVAGWFQAWGSWVMFIAALTPIPFKLFTIAGGALHIPLLPFIIGSFIGRSIRFYLVASLMRWGGERMDRWLKRTIDWVGWIVLLLLVVTYGVYTHRT